MKQNERIELSRRGPNRLEFWIVEVLARDVRADLGAAQPQYAHGVTQLVRSLSRRLHGQRCNGEKAVGASLGKFGELLILDSGKRCRNRRRLGIEEGLRRNREHLNIDLGCRHVLQTPLQIPAAAGKLPVEVPGYLEGGEVIVDVRQLRSHFRRFALQQADGLFRENVRVNVDRLHRLAGHGICCS